MMKQEIHDKFLSYLEKNAKALSERQRIEVVEVAEKYLPSFIRVNFYSKFGELYDETDHNIYLNIRNQVSTKAEAKATNRIGGTEFTHVMKYYAEFLQSKIFKGEEFVRLTSGELIEKEKNHPEQVSKDDPLLPPQDPNEELKEGRISQVNITKYERNRELRQLCLRHYGYSCQICAFNFEEVYGELGKAFIEVHHINPLAETNGEHVLDPKVGLIPLCSNCHSMIHRGLGGAVLTLEELRRIIIINIRNQ